MGAIAIIGGGPAGLIAADILSAAGCAVTLYEQMPSVGRKLLIAGRGGLNLTHSEPLPDFLARYGAAREWLAPMIEAFAPRDLIAWAEGLGQETFIGSSGRVFPKVMKASPLLRAWLARLAAQGVVIRTRWTWRGWDQAGALMFDTPEGAQTARADANLLALGGASWPKLGATGAWAAILAARGIETAPFAPANCGFACAWSEVFRDRFAGAPLKNIALQFNARSARGDALITAHGIEGGAIYALSAPLRDHIAAHGEALLSIDLRPDISAAQIAAKLSRPRGRDSVSSYLRKALNLSPLAINLMREAFGANLSAAPEALAGQIKAVPLTLIAPAPIARAISSAGGVTRAAVDERLMLRALPGTYVAGEMLDWEAPTGGYLLQATFASGAWAARAILASI